MSLKNIFCFLCCLIFAWYFLFSLKPVLAATFTFSSVPSNINQNESFSVSVILSISSSAEKNYYIRTAFFHPDSPSSYFGYTKNNAGNWYNGTPSPIDKTQFYKITMDSNDQWTGVVEVKPDPEYLVHKGSTTYNFKVGRYTESGSLTWCEDETSGCSIANIFINATLTPTPTPHFNNTPIPTLTPTKVPTPTKAPTPTKTPTPTPKKTPTPTPKSSVGSASQSQTNTSIPTPTASKQDKNITSDIANENEDVFPTAILGTSSAKPSLVSPTPTRSQDKTGGLSNSLVPKILIGLGGIFLVSCGIISFYKYKKRSIKNE